MLSLTFSTSLGALVSRTFPCDFQHPLIISFSPVWGPQFCSSSSIGWAAWSTAPWRCRVSFDPDPSGAPTPTTWGRCPPRSSRSPQGRCTEDTCPPWWGRAFIVRHKYGFIHCHRFIFFLKEKRSCRGNIHLYLLFISVMLLSTESGPAGPDGDHQQQHAGCPAGSGWPGICG